MLHDDDDEKMMRCQQRRGDGAATWQALGHTRKPSHHCP